MDAQAPAAGAAPLETWQTEFEGHTITVHTTAVYTDSRGNNPGNPVTSTDNTPVTADLNMSVNGNVIKGPAVLAFNLPADLADDPWNFAARFLKHEWRAQRENHDNTYPLEMPFGGIATCPKLQCACFFYEASLAHQGPPLLWAYWTGQTVFPAPPREDRLYFARKALAFKKDLLFMQGGSRAGAVAPGKAGHFAFRLLDMLERLADHLESVVPKEP